MKREFKSLPFTESSSWEKQIKKLNEKCGAPRAKPVAPYFTPQWGDISRLTSGRIHPRPKAVAFCCRGKI
jgi:hypothetical protein